jgi:hypothetical protein
MKYTKLIILIFSSIVVSTIYAESPSDIQQSHIEANVPPAMLFDTYLNRDLTTYFEIMNNENNIKVEYRMLRAKPTQSGVAYPKFYLAVKVGNKSGLVRVAAIEKSHFDVTKYVSCSDALRSQESISKVFPAALIENIIKFCKENKNV